MTNKEKLALPKDGLDGLKENATGDALSGFLVFLIALPLCIAISRASTGDVSALAGVITAVVGGLVVSLLMGGRLTIKGPAAGLIVIILGAVEELGRGDNAHGYKLMLAVVVISALFQILFGLVKAGVIGDFFPASAVHGMLASIGLIIISKQIHPLFGVATPKGGPFALFGEIPHTLASLNPYVTIIGITSLAILIIMPMVKNRFVKMVPAPLVVILVAILMGKLFHLDLEHSYLAGGRTYQINPAKFLVTLPGNVLDAITFPDFSAWADPITWKYIAMFAMVGTLESMLTVKAMDNMDPWKRKSDMNRDVLAVGIGNLTAGMLGGLPMIAEVVRSSANINNGARTRWANWFHGLFLLVFVLAFPGVIHSIPTAALAAMLVFTGYRLASPKTFIHTYEIGVEQLAIFCTTIIVTLAEDLLVGIAAGILLKFIIHIINGTRIANLFSSKVQISEDDKIITLYLKSEAIFSNYISFKKHLDAVKEGKTVVFDFSEARVVDHSFLEHIKHFENDYENTGGKVIMRGLENHTPMSEHPLASRKLKTSIGK